MNKFIGEFTYYRQLEETLISLISKCRIPSQIKQIQGRIIALGLHQNPYLSPKISTKFFELQNPALARHWFFQILRPNVVLWNVMFKGFTGANLHSDTLIFFNQMMKERRNDGFFVTPSAYTFTFVIKSCTFLSALRDGEQVHCFTIKTGWFHCNNFVGTTLIDMYSLNIENARKVFDEMPIKDVVSQTAIIRAYVCAGSVGFARQLFDRMEDRDVVLWNTMISGYTEKGDMKPARELFAQMPYYEKDTMAWNTILLGYANADGDLVDECGRFFFEEMPDEKKNIFSWNGLIGVYSHHGRFSCILAAFKQMLFNVEPNDATLAVVFSACSKLGALGFGRGIHSYVSKQHNRLLMSSCVGNGLIDVYAKCGCIEDAKNLFHSMKKETRDLISWNTMINGLASHGLGIEAIELFEQMEEEKCRPDGITFVGVLSACVHSVGLVERGITYFRFMVDKYMIDPWIEHYGCVVDLLSRAGLIHEALGLVKRISKSIEPDCVIWSTILGVCQQKLEDHGHEHDHEHQRQILITAELAMSRLVRLEPEDVTHYVMLSKIYGACKRWADVARLKLVVHKMSNMEVNRRGLSWVQLDSNSHCQLVEFCSSDSRHSRTEEIYETLKALRDVSTQAAIPEYAAVSFHAS